MVIYAPGIVKCRAWVTFAAALNISIVARNPTQFH